MEGNFFRNCKYPMLTSLQGTDVYNGSVGTFSGEDGGTIKAYNNTMSGQTRFVPYDAVNFPVQFDAYVASSRNEIVPSTITSLQGGNTYNNFDTDTSLYINTLTIDDPAVAKDNVIQHAGRVSGGDFVWVFDNSIDDISYAVNSGLLAALNTYTTAMVFIQGEIPPVANLQTLLVPNNNDQSVDNGIAIANMVFTWGGNATNVLVTGLPASGITYAIDSTAQTITISGVPTANVTFTVTTVGALGTPISGAGTISINGLPAGDQIHNFTLDALNSTFYTFTSANINSTAGLTTYDGLTLTARLKIETATNISYVTNSVSTLTLVFDPTFNGPIKLDGVSYTATSGVLVIPSVPAGNHAITKGNSANLYYIKTVFLALGNQQNTFAKVTVFPNPVTNMLNLFSINTIDKVLIFNLNGELVKEITGDVKNIDMTNLSIGNYLVQIISNDTIVTKKIIKN
jgi:pectate lyase